MLRVFATSSVALALAFAAASAGAQPLSPAEKEQIDKFVASTIRETGVPSASISVVRGGETVLVKAYGKASETIPIARADLPYQIASISKQFTAMGLLLLEDDGKLDLDDNVSKWLPDVSGGDTITIRQLLSHTAGLQDYWPQDYMFKTMTVPALPDGIVQRWGTKGLDFAPGADWQYSNTGYVVAGLILEKAAGEPLMGFLKRRVFDPVGIVPLDQDDTFKAGFPSGYSRYALGPVRPAPIPGRGWMFATGMLSMTAGDLAKWNLARINRAVFPADNWIAQEQPVIRRDGTTNGYGLGVQSTLTRSRRILSHTGGAVGFFSRNNVYPDRRAAITVLTNADFSDTINRLAVGIEQIVLGAPPAPVTEAPRIEDVKHVYASILAGTPNRSSLTENLNYYFDARTIGDFRASLAGLGQPTIELQGSPNLRGGFVGRTYALKFTGGRTLQLSTYSEPGASGRWEQFLISE